MLDAEAARRALAAVDVLELTGMVDDSPLGDSRGGEAPSVASSPWA
jgi:hypothetical protein